MEYIYIYLYAKYSRHTFQPSFLLTELGFVWNNNVYSSWLSYLPMQLAVALCHSLAKKICYKDFWKYSSSDKINVAGSAFCLFCPIIAWNTDIMPRGTAVIMTLWGSKHKGKSQHVSMADTNKSKILGPWRYYWPPTPATTLLTSQLLLM